MRGYYGNDRGHYGQSLVGAYVDLSDIGARLDRIEGNQPSKTILFLGGLAAISLWLGGGLSQKSRDRALGWVREKRQRWLRTPKVPTVPTIVDEKVVL